MLPRHAISGADRARIKDLLPGRPGAKGPTADNRRFVGAVLYVARAGLPWRDRPDRFGPWNSARRRFGRWARAGVWARVFEAVRGPDLEWLILDSTVIRAHPSAAGAQKKRATRPSAAAGAGSGRRPTRRGPGSGCPPGSS
jgi:transposase